MTKYAIYFLIYGVPAMICISSAWIVLIKYHNSNVKQSVTSLEGNLSSKSIKLTSDHALIVLLLILLVYGALNYFLDRKVMGVLYNDLLSEVKNKEVEKNRAIDLLSKTPIRIECLAIFPNNFKFDTNRGKLEFDCGTGSLQGQRHLKMTKSMKLPSKEQTYVITVYIPGDLIDYSIKRITYTPYRLGDGNVKDDLLLCYKSNEDIPIRSLLPMNKNSSDGQFLKSQIVLTNCK
ncbi:hypothetical protein [Dyadobacter bucti]|uniref:hypothetical protein n=1 Tax=Dyadobacter bucti TaxID=2572203 RepID=UPI001109BC09|nr:hypothetical protein [Dyadobacter bucti]